MNSTAEPTTAETLSTLHEAMCKQTEASGTLYDYLMNAQDYLKTDDLAGWKKEFAPEPTPPAKKQKRLKQSPFVAPIIPQDLCKECGEDAVLEDTANGQWVCLKCGLIQSLGVSMAWGAHSTSKEFTGNPYVYIHLYSRIMYFKDIVRFCHGESQPKITQELWDHMRANIDIASGVQAIETYLDQHKLTCLLRRHKWSILVALGGKPLLNFPPQARLIMNKMFRCVEYYWKYYGKIVCPGRKVFFPYYILIFQFASQLGLDPPRSLLPVRKKGAEKHIESYRKLCVFTKYQWFT